MSIQTTTESRYHELYRPQFHFSPQAGWTNDPNGLVYYAGEYHLFYQYHPSGPVMKSMHWGHATSPDLIHWTHLAVALRPDQIGGIWSGSAVADVNDTSGLVPGGGLVAIFSYHDQSQGLAYSTDDGRTWTKYEGNPVIPVGGKDFRDPKVFWHPETGKWVMTIAAGDRIKTYTSSNLIDWTFGSDFGSDQGWHGGVWECPDLFPLQVEGKTKWVLLTSLAGAPSGGRGTQYFIGNFDGRNFANDNPSDTVLWLDYGRDNYAGVTWNNTPDGSRVFIGWMNDWTYARRISTSPWRGAMTIPRTLGLKNLREGFRLVQSPVPQLEQLRGAAENWRNQIVSPGNNLLAGVTGKTVEIIGEFLINSANAATAFGFKVHKSADGSQFTMIAYDTRSSKLSVERSRSGNTLFDPAFPGVHQVYLSPVEGHIKMRILVDWSSVEVFGNDGEVVITDQVFPDVTSDQLELFASDGDVTLVSLDVYQLRRIWP